MPVTPPPGPVSETWKMRTDCPGTIEDAAGLLLNFMLSGPLVPQPSSEEIAT